MEDLRKRQSVESSLSHWRSLQLTFYFPSSNYGWKWQHFGCFGWLVHPAIKTKPFYSFGKNHSKSAAKTSSRVAKLPPNLWKQLNLVNLGLQIAIIGNTGLLPADSCLAAALCITYRNIRRTPCNHRVLLVKYCHCKWMHLCCVCRYSCSWQIDQCHFFSGDGICRWHGNGCCHYCIREYCSP